MNTVLIYMMKTALYLAAFYIFYALLLSKDTLYGRNRTFILLSLLCSLLFPLITIQTRQPFNLPFFGKTLSEVLIQGIPGGSSETAASEGSGTSWPGIVWTLYLSGVTIFGLKLIIDVTELVYLIIRKKNHGSKIIRFRGFNTAGFSALGYVFINLRLSPEESKAITKHEENHIEQNHFFDIVFIEIIKVLQWFNPIIYLYDRSLRAVHEYQADEGCLNSGVSVANYQSLLLNQIFRSKIFPLTNCFSNPTLIKKRMIMMTKTRSGAIANLKLLLVLPIVAVVMLIFSSCSESKQSIEDEFKEMTSPPPPPPPVSEDTEPAPFVVVEEMPMFPGGEAALLEYIRENTQYPEVAKENNVQGKVIVRFCVTSKGTVDQISVLKGVDPELDEEAKRVVSTLPPFRPGRQDGKPVPVWFMVPITFTLK
jgi:TonB family protein